MKQAQWQRIEELYYEALDLSATERHDFLLRACAGDDALRREVESLLAARAEAGEFLAQPILGRTLSSASSPTMSAALSARLGSFIGHYKLCAVLGVGGMGEVFLAADTRLQRQVALKLLPPQFSQQPGRVRRFEQEARATTALNHPNIVTLYDTGQHAGSYFIVNEWVDGQTLRAHLQKRGALPTSEALDIAQQIATALAAAHTAGIVHRDIKPENVMLRRDGFVKVLDFGLAKLTGAQAESAVPDETQDEENQPAASCSPHSQTAAGVLLGTIRYMSPEQARGERVDARTDVFSLGVVLYEMLTGQPPFQRATANETLAAILEAEPEALPAGTPEALRQLLANVLRKDRAARLPTAEDFAASLRGLMEELQFGARLVEARGWRFELRRWPLWAGVVLLAAVFAALWRQPRESFESPVLPQLKYTRVDSWKAEPTQSWGVLSSSPDGNLLVFAKVQNGQPDIFLKPVDGGATRNLTADAWNDFGPVWSPSGHEVAYVSLRGEQSQIWAVQVESGARRQLGTLPARPLWLTSWPRTGANIYYEAAGNLYSFAVATGASRQLTRLSADTTGPEFAVSFDEQWLAYQQKVANVRQLFVAPLTGGAPRQITHEGEANNTPQWLPDGERLVYSSLRNGVQQICLAFRDGRTPIQITSGHEHMEPWEVTRDGRRIFYFSKPDAEADLYLLDLRTGAERRLSNAQPEELFPAFAPNGQRLVFQQANQHRRFYQQTLVGQGLADSEPQRLNESGADARWSPRGDQIAFLRQEGTAYQLWTMGADGTGARLLVKELSFIGYAAKPGGWLAPPNFSWSPDGSRLAYAALRARQSNLFTLAAAGANEIQLTDNTDATLKLFSPIWSPDGKQLVYQGRRTVAGQVQHTVYLHNGVHSRLLWQAPEELRLLGWSATQADFFVATIRATARWIDPHPVKLWRLATAAAGAQPPAAEVMQFEHAYWQTFTLAPTAKQIAFVARQDNAANVWLVTLATGQRRRLTANDDPSLSLGCLTWAPQANLLGFTKQSDTTSIWMIENFK